MTPLFWEHLQKNSYNYYFCLFDSAFGVLRTGLCPWTPLGDFHPTEPLMWPLWKLIASAPLTPLEAQSHALMGSHCREPITFVCLKLNLFGLLAIFRHEISVSCHRFLLPTASTEKKETTGWPNTFSSLKIRNIIFQYTGHNCYPIKTTDKYRPSYLQYT